MKAQLFLRVALGAVAVSLATPALAQNAKTADAEAVGLQEIVVTAQKRAEDVQSIPISIGVVTGADMAAKAQNSIDAALRTVPSVEVQGLAQGAQLYIRGIGSSVDPGFADPSVALTVDGAYNGRTETVTSGAYDIDRIEVLRGPQGTLYGRNASGGSVNVITTNPKLGDFGGFIRGQIGNYDLRRIEGAINVPLGDNLALRVAGFREKRDGYVDDGSYDANAYGFRGKLLFEPTDWLRIVLKADIYREKGKGANSVPVPGSAGNLFFPPPYFTTNFNPPLAAATNPPVCPGSPFVGCAPILRFPNGYTQLKPGDPWSNNLEHTPGTINRKGESLSAQIDADLGFATLTVLPSYSRNRNSLTSSFLFGSILPGSGPTYTINSNYESQPADTKYTSVETRLASNGGGPFKYVIGFYYLRSDGGAPLATQTLTTNTGDTGTFAQTILPGSTVAGFGQLTYSITDDFRVTGGLRISRDKSSQSYNVTVGGVSTGLQTFATSQSATQYKIGFEYDLAEKSMLYGHIATGFKAGGISTTVPPTPFLPEHLTSIEIGIKNRFPDDRIQLNLAAFHYDYKNYQFQAFQTLPIGNTTATANFPVIGNADKSKVKGAEVELDALLWTGAHIKGSLTWLDAKYGQAILPVNPFVGVGLDLAGKQIQNAPKIAANIGFDQEVPIGSGMLRFSVNSHLSDGYYVTPEQYLPSSYQKSFTRTDLGLRYSGEGDKFSIGIWLRNLENKAQTTYVFPAYRRFISNPRTFGISAGVNF